MLDSTKKFCGHLRWRYINKIIKWRWKKTQRASNETTQPARVRNNKIGFLSVKNDPKKGKTASIIKYTTTLKIV